MPSQSFGKVGPAADWIQWLCQTLGRSKSNAQFTDAEIVAIAGLTA
jgi:hypothetical protein